MSEYRSIPCVDHERLEFAVLRRQRLRLHWREESGVEMDSVILPVDVATRDGAEWLSFRREDGPVQVVRLDHILGFAPA